MALALLRAAFEKPETIQPLAKNPSRTLLLLRHLADLTDLEELWLIATKITDDGLAHITGCTKLAILSIEATEATDKSVEHLKKLENLKVLHVKNSKITAEGVKELNAALPDCLVPK